jgi:hypothetical protein
VDKIIGLGKFGCAVAEQLTEHPEYRIYKIAPDIQERASLSIGVWEDMEEYEKNVDQNEVEIYLRSIRSGDEVLVVVEGGDPVSGATLRILETIQDARLSVLYVCPDRELISEIQKRDDKIAFNILQQYARSGKFERLFLINKTSAEYLMGDVSIQEYEHSLTHFISYLVAMLNYFSYTDPVLSSKISPHDHCRIKTFGISSLEEKQQSVNFLFPLEEMTDLHFFYGVPKGKMEDDASLSNRIKTHTKTHRTESIATSFSVYPTTFDQMLVLCVGHSSKIQTLDASVY